mgnify:CR=1 FL=1
MHARRESGCGSRQACAYSGIGHNVDVGDGVVPQFVAGRCGGQEIGQGAGKPIIFKPLQESDELGCRLLLEGQ